MSLIIPDKGPLKKPASSKTPPVPANGSDRRFENMKPSNPINKLTSLREELKKLQLRIPDLERAIKKSQDLSRQEGIPVAVFFEAKRYTIADARQLLLDLRGREAYLKKDIASWEGLVNGKKGNGSGGNKGNKGDSGPPENEGDSAKGAGTPVIYNVPAVNDAYFKSDQSLFAKQTSANWYAEGKTQIDSYIYSGNTPKSVVTNALELWQSSSSGKGMIQTWFPSGKPPGSSEGQTWSNMGAAKSVQKYGFQFLYNPGNISMSYGGVPDVDLTMLTSGTEDYLAANPSIFKSAISFDILINRMFDIQYLGPGGKLKGEVKATDIYSGKIPTAKDLKKIYNRGTMYDLEFLLQSMFAYSPVATELRNKTWDVGYLGGFPVEMHLGNKLRYVVLIDSITVNHVIFDHRMVPLFSNVSISARRVPDFKAGVVKDASGSSSGSGIGTNSNSGLSFKDRKNLK
jgi:hypothetical protein